MFVCCFALVLFNKQSFSFCTRQFVNLARARVRVSVVLKRSKGWLKEMMASGEVKLDALPYFDKGYDEPGVREAVSVDKAKDGITIFHLMRITIRLCSWLKKKQGGTGQQRTI